MIYEDRDEGVAAPEINGIHLTHRRGLRRFST
jgi:hypothetical protein